MKSFLSTALILGVFSTFGLVGCGEESKVKDETTVSGPEGSTTTTTETSVEKTGENPPAATTTPPAETPVEAPK
jgi:hypothetical protein